MVANTETDIVSDALSLIRAKAAGEAADPDDYALSVRFLNRMVAQWQTMGMHVWTRKQGILFFQPSQAEYVTGTDHIIDVSEFVETTSTAAAASAATVVPVTSVTGMTAGDNFGIKVDDGTIHWTTIDGIASLNVTVNDALDDDAASGARVYTYTTGLGKILRVKSSRRFEYTDGTNGSEIEMIDLSNQDYFALPNKGTTGTPTNFYYRPQVTTGQFYFWPLPSATDYLAKFTYYAEIGEFTSTADTADFPEEWVEALVYNLAVRVAPMFGVQVMPDIKERAVGSLIAAKDWDQGDQSIFLTFSNTRWP
jgi:hypothetical protein